MINSTMFIVDLQYDMSAGDKLDMVQTSEPRVDVYVLFRVVYDGFSLRCDL